jgi:hypothetical protein
LKFLGSETLHALLQVSRIILSQNLKLIFKNFPLASPVINGVTAEEFSASDPFPELVNY